MGRTDDPTGRIAELRALGMEPVTIVARMVIEGWDREAVRAALGLTAPSRAPAPSAATAGPIVIPEPLAPKGASQLSPRAIGAGLLVGALVAVAFSAYTYIRTPVVYSISVPSATASSTVIEYGAIPALADPGYYERVKASFVDAGASFIVADLTAMKLSVYVSGKEALAAPILAKGKPGSWWETPVGVYQVETRERNHFSSLGHVYQPYSLAFQGNFFIHGWPYYEDGTPVSSSYSGGCIRLSTEDAAQVYALASVGMPVIVHATFETADAFEYEIRSPQLPVAAYLLVDLKNGTVLAHEAPDQELPIASITKLVTALVTIEYLNLDKSVTIRPDMLVQTSVPRLRGVKEATVHDLLILMLTESSNEAAEALAQHLGRDYFISLMNKKAQAIGLTKTRFTDPSGLDDGNVSSAEDLYRLLKYIDDNRRFILKVSSDTLEHDPYGAPAFRGIQNFNFVKGVKSGFVGGKIGNTDAAKQTYAGIFRVALQGGVERDIAAIVLGSRDVEADMRKLLRFIETGYEAEQGS